MTTYTTNKNIAKPALNDLNWDVPLNSDFDVIDKAFGGIQTFSLSNSNVSITLSQAQNAIFSLTGTLTANVTLSLPINSAGAGVAVAGNWTVSNQTTGSYTVTINTLASGSTGIVVNQGVRSIIVSDGTNVYLADDRASTATGTGPGTFTTLSASGAATFSSTLSVAGTSSFATISSGIWNGSVVGVAYGGTGSATAAGARANLGIFTVGKTSQTVLSGPVNSSGQPNFLPATSASLVLTTQNISSASPLISSASAGWGVSGRQDYVAYATSNFSFPSATPNNTNYFYLDIDSSGTATPGISISAPTYQYAGTRSTTSGQFTFNYNPAEFSGTLGNGSAAVASTRVYLGQCVAATSTITSVTMYAYQGTFVSSQFAVPALNTAATIQHNLGCDMASVVGNVVAVFQTSWNGYSAGATTQIFTSSTDGSAPLSFPAFINTDKNTSSVPAVNQAFKVLSPSSTAYVTLPSGTGTAQFVAMIQRSW